MNKKLLCSLLSAAMILTGCSNTNDSSSGISGDPSSTPSDTTLPSESSNPSNSSTGSESTSDSSSTAEKVENYVEISDVSQLFETYATAEDYDFIANYDCQVVQDRVYQGGWQTEYMFDGTNLLLTYEESGATYTDYFIDGVYYMDNGAGVYKSLHEDNEFYYTLVSTIDYFELAGIEWEDDMIFDLENHVAIPSSKIAKDKVGRTIFGSNANEYWHEVKIHWEDGYISKIEAVSIYQEVTYYYTVELSEHGFTAGSVKAPVAEEYTNPYQPYLKGKEEYTGVAITDEQYAAINMFTSEFDMNYTVDISWEYVIDGELTGYTTDYKLLAQDGNYEYSYADPEAPTLIHYFYMLNENATSYPLIFMDEDFNSEWEFVTYGMTDYESYYSLIYLDVVKLFNIDKADLIYDEQKGYITAASEEIELDYCNDIFSFVDSYAGLRIYLKEDNGSLVLDKIVTSVYITDESGAYYSFLKTYTFTQINSTTIQYPDGVSL